MSIEPGQRAELVIFVGLPASGKTSFYRLYFARTHVHVSKDVMRHNRRPERRQAELIHAALARGHSVVVDNTNLTRASRAPLIALGRALNARGVGYFFEADARDCLRRNDARAGRERVPPVAIMAARKRLQPPAIEEGFDELRVVRLSENRGFELVSSDVSGARCGK